MGNTLSAAVTEHRVLEPADARVVATIGLVLLVIATAIVRWPLVLAIPAALVFVWVGGALLLRAWRLLRRSRESRSR